MAFSDGAPHRLTYLLHALMIGQLVPTLDSKLHYCLHRFCKSVWCGVTREIVWSAVCLWCAVCVMPLLWIKNFYNAHTHQTNVGSFLSNTELKPGVVRGNSIVGRSYSLYTLTSYSNRFGQNDMVTLFSRRRKIVRTERQWCTRSVLQLQEAVDALVAWAKEWQLSISVNECCVLNVGKSHVWYLRQYWRHSFFLVIWVLQFYMICHLRCT